MAKAVTVVVYPTGASLGDLTVLDAMQQVLDAFSLLIGAEAVRDGRGSVIWKLDEATTMSPLTVRSSAISNDSGINVELVASHAALSLHNALTDVLHGNAYPSWMTANEPTLRRMLGRVMNGVGRTDFQLVDDLPPVVLSHRSASTAIHYLDRLAAEETDLTRTEYGSIEGEVIAATTWYNKPSLIVRHRLSGANITCVCRSDVANEIGHLYDWASIWAHRRVLIAGAICYNALGQIIKIEVHRIAPLEGATVDIAAFIGEPRSQVEIEKWLENAWGNSDA